VRDDGRRVPLHSGAPRPKSCCGGVFEMTAAAHGAHLFALLAVPAPHCDCLRTFYLPIPFLFTINLSRKSNNRMEDAYCCSTPSHTACLSCLLLFSFAFLTYLPDQCLLPSLSAASVSLPLSNNGIALLAGQPISLLSHLGATILCCIKENVFSMSPILYLLQKHAAPSCFCMAANIAFTVYYSSTTHPAHPLYLLYIFITETWLPLPTLHLALPLRCLLALCLCITSGAKHALLPASADMNICFI